MDKKETLEQTSLADDKVLGKIVDAQGITAIKPPLYDRWTPACANLPIKPGDWLRTDARGANALQVRLANKSSLILGPGSLVELTSADELRATSGEFEVQTANGAKLTVHGPGEQKQTISGTKVLRVQGEKLVEVAKEPKWLLGFKGTIVNETLGSLVATVEGRNVPLTVGDHKVRVDIRDQIARTTIEESFVNHTGSTLEGVFYFPLPADASISGFGMWIGDQLVEADVVEKQRAREIYETILRERRDPGLLEWSGGNLFKARVFPIFAHSEKRIKITYTQVLPLRGAAYRYSYALQSEMLKQNPLRELKIDVHVHSSLPLKDVASPTHTVRKNQTKHSAHVEFSAQEYTPTRDFEVVIDVERQGQEVVFVPHQRGSDGYFMLLINPPGSGAWEREVIANGEPLDVILLADTSGSMNQSLRETQEQFITAVLGSLGPKDRFRLAACDVDCTWASEEAQAANDKNVAAAREFLGRRRSLGWTDLDAAFRSVLERVQPNTHVIYIGDGITTTGDADPGDFANRLRQMYAGRGTFHAVTPGSTYESAVLQSIASLGGGSVRRIAADASANGAGSPSSVARQLLSEIAQPAIRDLKVEFNGLRAARVYPERLPNLPAGAQQIVIGRYLPDAASTQGEVVVTGTQNGKPVRFRTAISLDEAAAQARRASEQTLADEHSFIPRLWARMHLDFLLQQGQTQIIQDDIIALSEEYQIMTPYTSFLVLESDADRERFKVKRSFQMRDGEKFFAQGRDNANFELKQQQMKRAGIWRMNLQRRVLNQLATLGRNPAIFRPHAHGPYPGMAKSRGRMAGGFGGGDLLQLGDVDTNMPMSAAGPVSFDRFSIDESESMPEEARLGAKDALSREDLFVEAESDKKEDGADLDDDAAAGERLSLAKSEPDGPTDLAEKPANHLSERLEQLGQVVSEEFEMKASLAFEPEDRRKSLLRGLDGTYAELGGVPGAAGRRPGGWSGYHPAPGYHWFQSLIPTVPAPPGIEKPLPASQAWPAEARAIAESLLRRDELAKLAGGVEVNIETQGFDVRRSATSYRNYERLLISPKAWLERHWGDTAQTTLNWANEQERGTIAVAFGIGRTRGASPADLTAFTLDITDYSLVSLERTYAGYKPQLERQGDDRVVIRLKAKSSDEYETRVLIDTKRNVVLRVSSFHRDKLTSATAFSDFVEVAGTWWATRVETTDDQERATSVAKLTVKELNAEQTKQAIDGELAMRDKVIFFKQPLPTVRAAKQAVADAKADINHHLVLALYHGATQQWEPVKEHVDQLVQLAGDKPGRQWLAMATLMMTRRNEELRKEFLAKGRDLADLAKAGRSANNEYFLATHLLGQASQVLQANELLELLDSLRPVYDKLPAYLLGDKLWKSQRVSYLQQVGQHDAAFELLKELATKYRDDQSLQSQYVHALANRGEYAAAYEWLDRLLADKNLQLTPSEADSLRGIYAQFLENEGRVSDLAAYLEKWIALNPDSSTPYQQYLSALQRNDQENKVDELIEKWLAEGRDAVAKDEPVSAPIAARLQAAVNYALGHVGPWWTYRIEEKWLEPLAKTVRVLAQHKDQYYVANSIMQHQNFRYTDFAKKLRKELTDLLAAQAATLPPERIHQIVGWIAHNDPIVELKTWKEIAAALEKRWATVDEIGDRRQLASTLVQVYGSHIGQTELLAFLERQLKEGPKEDRPAHVLQLFDTLLTQPWKQEYEDRAYALLTDIGEPAPAEQAEELDAEEQALRRLQKLVTKLDALHRLNDRMVIARRDATMAAVEHQEKLTRKELADKQKAALAEARTAIADRLARDREKYGSELAPWLTVERTYLEVRLARKTDDAVGEAWEFVGTKPKPVDFDEPLEVLLHILRTRHLTTLAYLSTRKGADEALAERLLTYYRDGLQQAKDDEDAQRKHWQAQQFRLLVAVDRPEQLEKLLREWIDPKNADNTWKVALGYLAAERAKFAEAIALFEQVEKADELGPAEYRVLADWYQIENQREKHERASLASYTSLGERWLAARLNHLANPWYRGENLPTELDPEILKLLTALFRKSEHPQNYVYQLQRLYQSTRDFRLVATLADGAIGHTALKIYPILEQMRSLLTDVRDEATVDQLAEHLRSVRKQAKTDVDRRAMDLLETLIERRAAELRNQPDPHVRTAIEALRRANRGAWADGERRLMADLLANLGKIAAKPLADEQLRLLAALHGAEPAGSFDRLYIAERLANTHWYYSDWDKAISLLQAALAEFRQASGGVLPQSANNALSTFVNFLSARGQYSRGEQVYLSEIKTAPNTQQRHWLVQQLYALYTSAISNDARISLGKGHTLYKAAEQKMLADLDTPDHNHRYQLASLICTLYRAAHHKQLPGVADDLRAFAFKRLPTVLKRQTSNYSYIVSNVASTLHDVASARDGLAFLVERIEQEPRWLRYQGHDGWSQHSHYLAYWRTEAKNLGELEPRLLKIVTDELRRDLHSRQARNRNMYVKHNSYYWAEKEDAFALVAEEVLEKNMNSSATIAYIAEYLFGGLGRQNRAIEILIAAHQREVLDETAQAQLINYLHHVGRFAESIAMLQPLVERRPDTMTFRVQLMHAYFRTKQNDKLVALLNDTDKRFHEKKLWTESHIESLAKSTLENHLFEQSVAYYKEVIGLRERTAPNRGIGDGTLSAYYTGLAQAHAGLKQTAEAVEAAGAAIVAWGPRHQQDRAHALATLRSVLEQSPDLDAFVKRLDTQVAETGLENPIVRKAVGSVYLARSNFPTAIAQLKKAADVQPNDAETHQLLVSAYDQSGDKQGAIEQLFASVELSRRELSLYKSLAERYQAVGDQKQAERAYLTIVEMLPSESESHTMLAEVRQQQSRWSDAADHWRRVAEIRKLEPTGLLKLAAAQLQLKQWDEAQKTLRTLEKRDWPARFSDVHNQIHQLQRDLDGKRS